MPSGISAPGLCCLLTVLAYLPAPGANPAGVDYDLTAAMSLTMGGTSMSDPGQGYAVAMTEQYIDPFFGVAIAAGGQHVVVYPAQIWPVSCAGSSPRDCLTFDASVNQGIEDLAQAIARYPQDTKYILGYSQSTQIQTLTKRALMLDAQMAGGEFEDYPDVKMSMVANIDKPNGGVLERFSWAWPTPTTLRPLGITAYGPTPTNTPVDPLNPAEHAIDTVNISFVYDGMGDFPANPFNPLAVANAVLGIAYLHNTYPFQTGISPANPRVFYQGSYQDSAYYMITTELIPLLRPLQQIGVPTPVLRFLNAPLQVLVETGYDRRTNPGVPVPFRLTWTNPITVAQNLTRSLAVGFDDAAAELGHGRPLGTTPAGPFGVGGPTGPIPEPAAVPMAAAAGAAPVQAREAPQPRAFAEDPSAAELGVGAAGEIRPARSSSRPPGVPRRHAKPDTDKDHGRARPAKRR